MNIIKDSCKRMRCLLAVLVVAIILSAKGLLIEVDYGFIEGSQCESSGHTLTMSIPISCNAALVELLAGQGLPVDLLTSPEDLRDLCNTYCTTPMRQIGEDCPQLQTLHQSLSAACDTNNNATRCFDIREWLWPVLSNCSNTGCSESCLQTLRWAHSNMGCCLGAFSNNQHLKHHLQQCNFNYTLCSEGGQSPSLPLVILAALTLLAL